MALCLLSFISGRLLSAKTQVDSAIKIEKFAKITLIGITLLTVLSTLLGLVFIGISNPSHTAGIIMIALVVRLVWNASLILLSYQTWKASQNCFTYLLAFHDFLIEYR
jgi:hypothetical protein